MARSSSFACSECGAAQPQWVGRCPSCGAWGTIAEIAGKGGRRAKAGLTRLSEVDAQASARRPIGIGELDRVLGGGLVPGSLVLLAGDPGIGKSTLILAVAARCGETLYAAGEESPAQIRLRADRLGLPADRIAVTTEPTAEGIAQLAESARPGLIIVDSIQTIRTETPSGVGAVNQIRESAAVLLRCAKTLEIPIVLIGHVTKSGDVAGPMLLEHLVDVVLMMEADTSGAFRLVRGLKNRFGSTDEIGLFRMTEQGLAEVANPSEILLSEGAGGRPGSAVVATLEGRRPLLVELQALTVPTTYGLPRRLATGVDPNRLAMLLAVLERRGGIESSKDDVYLNSAGGFRVKETAADLGIVSAVTSALRNRALPSRTVFLGEVGLGGEIRPVPRLEARLREAAGLGFERAFAPKQKIEGKSPIELVTVKTIEELLENLM
jgi:DNA repair protein RadA/Sms